MSIKWVKLYSDFCVIRIENWWNWSAELLVRYSCIIVVIIMWTTEKPSQKNISLTSQLSGPLIGSNGFIYSKSWVWCHSFQPIKEHYLCFVVFCLLFLITVDTQRQLFHSITTESNNINNKQLCPSLIPKLSNN